MDVKETVACNLRRLRDDRKLSLDAAAQLTGVSKSMLGQIERGDVNPTISVLWKIANGLKISFSALLERAEGGTSVVRAAEASPLLEDAGNYRNYPVFPFDETHPFELYRIEIEPGGHLEAAPHLPRHRGEHHRLFPGCGRFGRRHGLPARPRGLHPLRRGPSPRLPQRRNRNRGVEHGHLLRKITKAGP